MPPSRWPMRMADRTRETKGTFTTVVISGICVAVHLEPMPSPWLGGEMAAGWASMHSALTGIRMGLIQHFFG